MPDEFSAELEAYARHVQKCLGIKVDFENANGHRHRCCQITGPLPWIHAAHAQLIRRLNFLKAERADMDCEVYGPVESGYLER